MSTLNAVLLVFIGVLFISLMIRIQKRRQAIAEIDRLIYNMEDKIGCANAKSLFCQIRHLSSTFGIDIDLNSIRDVAAESIQRSYIRALLEHEKSIERLEYLKINRDNAEQGEINTLEQVSKQSIKNLSKLTLDHLWIVTTPPTLPLPTNYEPVTS